MSYNITSVEILSVKCISPSSGLSSDGMFAAEIAGTVIGAVAGTGIAVVSGGSGSAAVPLGMVLGAGGGVAAAYGLDKTVAGDADDLFIKVNDKKVWPSGKDSKSIESQQTRNVRRTHSSTNDMKIKLREYDSMSGNDRLGSYTVRYGQESGYYSALVTSASESASLYELNVLVWNATVPAASSGSVAQIAARATEAIGNAKQELLTGFRDDVLAFLRPWLTTAAA